MIACAYLAFGRVALDVDERNLGVGGAAMLSAVAEVSGASKKTIRDALAEAGDVGDVARLGVDTVADHDQLDLDVRGRLQTLRGLARERGRSPMVRTTTDT